MVQVEHEPVKVELRYTYTSSNKTLHFVIKTYYVFRIDIINRWDYNNKFAFLQSF